MAEQLLRRTLKPESLKSRGELRTGDEARVVRIDGFEGFPDPPELRVDPGLQNAPNALSLGNCRWGY